MRKLLGALAIVALLILATSTPAITQNPTLMRLLDGAGNRITSSTEGSLQPIHVGIVDPATNALAAFVTEDRNAGAASANTLRQIAASDSPDVVSLASILTALQLIDNDQTGATPAAITSAASTNATNVAAAPARLLGAYLVNTTTTIYHIRFYNLTSAPTCSSATGYVWTFPVPPASAAGGAGGFSIPLPPSGIAFGTGLGYCITGGPTSTDNTNAAVGIYGVLAYK